jgi:hypothetical protein
VLHANRGQMKRVLGQQEHALKAVLRIRIHMFLDPDPSIIMQI